MNLSYQGFEFECTQSLTVETTYTCAHYMGPVIAGQEQYRNVYHVVADENWSLSRFEGIDRIGMPDNCDCSRRASRIPL